MRWIINGTSTDEEASWEVNDVTVYEAATSGGNPVNLNIELMQYYLLVKSGGRVVLDGISRIK